MSSSASLTNQSRQSVCVPYHRGFLDSTAHVVVCEAKFVSQVLDQVRRRTNSIVDDRVPSGSAHALLGCYRDQVELIDVFVSNLSVDNRSRKRVREPANITAKKSSVHTLTGVDVHELGV